MPLFLLKTIDGKIEQVIRAKCLSCSRSVAAQNAQGEGPMVWRDPALSTVQVIEPDFVVQGVVLRKENANATAE
jgi:hypothetical protein